MDKEQVEKLKQLISRTDMGGNEKVEWLINFVDDNQRELLIDFITWSGFDTGEDAIDLADEYFAEL